MDYKITMNTLLKIVITFGFIIIVTEETFSQKNVKIPSVYTNIGSDKVGIYVNYQGTKIYAKSSSRQVQPIKFH